MLDPMISIPANNSPQRMFRSSMYADIHSPTPRRGSGLGRAACIENGVATGELAWPDPDDGAAGSDEAESELENAGFLAAGLGPVAE